MPIVWPYYALCKKVFGYRAIKNKLKRAKASSEEKDWVPSEIKALLTYFGQNFHSISNNTDDITKWYSLSRQLSKTQTSCREKFLDLRKSYRKLKTMKSRNPDCRVSWQYFNIIDEIYAKEGLGPDGVDMGTEEKVPSELPTVESDAQDEGWYISY